jgi:hypothetical protein
MNREDFILGANSFNSNKWKASRVSYATYAYFLRNDKDGLNKNVPDDLKEKYIDAIKNVFQTDNKKNIAKGLCSDINGMTDFIGELQGDIQSIN